MAGTFFENAREPAFIMDPRQNRVVAANDAGCALLGYTRDEMVGLHVARIHPSEMPELSALLDEVARNGRASTIKLTCRTKRGTFLPTEISLHSIVGRRGHPHPRARPGPQRPSRTTHPLSRDSGAAERRASRW